MSSLYHYNSVDLFRKKENYDVIPGGENFSFMFYIVGGNYVYYDRTGNISIPLNYDLMPHLRLPTYKVMSKSFEQICDERAIHLYERAKSSNRKLAIMYSGGIDSTLVVTSFLRNLSKQQLKDVVVLMNEESIHENRNFYFDHISKNLKCESSMNYGLYITSKEYLLISGEQADQLFLPNIIFDFLEYKKCSLDVTSAPLEQTSGMLIDYFNYAIPDYKKTNTAEHIYHIFDKTSKSCPIEIKNIQDLLWWHILVTKWQSCYTRMLAFVPNPHLIEFETGYTTFFCNDDFQLWSMNNRDSILKSSLTTYKFVQREYIFSYNKDEQYYKEKRKRGSLGSTVRRKRPISYLNNNMKYSYDIPSKEYYNINNDFVNWS
jgi:hypothetical protein